MGSGIALVLPEALEVWPVSTVKVCLDGNLAPFMPGKTFLMKEAAGHGPRL